MILIVATACLIGVAILDDQGIVFQPTKLFNQQKQYVINYQTNSLVRAGPFFFGLIMGLFIIEGLEKV